MNCAEAKRWIAFTREGELSAEEEHALAAHLLECPSCAAERASFLRQERSLEKLRSIIPSLRDPEASVQNILHRVQREMVPRHQGALRTLVDRMIRALEVPGLRYALAVFVTITVTGFVYQQVTILRSVRALEARLSEPEAPRIHVEYVMPPESVERLARSQEIRGILKTVSPGESSGRLRVDAARLGFLAEVLDSPGSRLMLHTLLPGGGGGGIDTLIADLSRNVHRVLTY